MTSCRKKCACFLNEKLSVEMPHRLTLEHSAESAADVSLGSVMADLRSVAGGLPLRQRCHRRARVAGVVCRIWGESVYRGSADYTIHETSHGADQPEF